MQTDNESVELIASLQEAMLTALDETSMVLQGSKVVVGAGSLCSEAFKSELHGFSLAEEPEEPEELCDYSLKASIYETNPYGDNRITSSLQLANYSVKSIELVGADAQTL